MTTVRLSDVVAGYGHGPDIVRGASLTLEEGQAAAILGPSGCGKSTLLKVMAGLVPVRSGTAAILGRNPGRCPSGTVGYIPQRLGLVRHASVLDNVLQGTWHRSSAWRSLAAAPRRADVEHALGSIEDVGLGGHEHRPVHLLSGGQQRRVAIARAVVQRPKVLLADEFLGELDPATVDTVLSVVRRLQHEHGTTMVIVEHHLEQAQRIADHVLCMDDGRLRHASAPLPPIQVQA